MPREQSQRIKLGPWQIVSRVNAVERLEHPDDDIRRLREGELL